MPAQHRHVEYIHLPTRQEKMISLLATLEFKSECPNTHTTQLFRIKMLIYHVMS